MKKYYSLYGHLLSEKVLKNAFKQVRRSNGAPGIDKQTVDDFGNNLGEEISILLTELKDKSYRSTPVRRVEIDKPDGGKRKLGIPTVRDRVVQQAVRSLLEPLFDKDFHPSSYGYRKGMSCHHAISKAQLNCKKIMSNLMAWIRRRLRAVQMNLWKTPAKLHRKLRQSGFYGEFKKIAMKSWHNSSSKQASMAMPNKWFHQELKLYDMALVETGFTISVI